jgi:hypothetical protein
MHQDAFVRTTLSINDAILQQLRELARKSGKPFRQVVEETLLVGLTRQGKRRASPHFRVRPHSLGLKPGFSGVSLNQLYDQLEAEETLSQRQER